MRYFKSFFKHTWQPQQMDSGRYSGPRHCEPRRSEDTELGELRSVTTATAVTDGPMSVGGVPCYEGACKPSRQQPVHRLDSPWHYLKTIFLVSIIASFIVWLIAYVILTQYGFV